MTVRMRHASVPDEIEVPESAVPFHGSAGWVVVEDDPPADAAPAEAPDSSGASSVKSKTPTRRSSKEA